METLDTLHANSASFVFAGYIRDGVPFNTSGALQARTEFAGLGEYKPFDEADLDEIRNAVYVIYSYLTPIAWRTAEGVWCYNVTSYSNTTRKHQNKIFEAINEVLDS